MNTGQVSIIIPDRNGQPYLQYTIDGLLKKIACFCWKKQIKADAKYDFSKVGKKGFWLND